VQNCCKGDEPCQWNTPIFRPSAIENPWTDRHQIWQGWLRRGHHPTSKLWYFYPQGGQLYICVKLSSSVSIFYTPRYFLIPCAPVEIAQFDQFSCFMAQKTCFGDSYILFGVWAKIFNNFHYFSPKKRKIPYSLQCKTSIGNNSGSIKDTGVKFAYSMELSATADRMVWHHLCHVTGSDHAHRFGVKQHLECV